MPPRRRSLLDPPQRERALCDLLPAMDALVNADVAFHDGAHTIGQRWLEDALHRLRALPDSSPAVLAYERWLDRGLT